MGHMNVMWYVSKFDEACWQLLAKVGISANRARQERAGMAAVEQRIEYKQELYAGDVVSIRSKMLEVREKSVRMQHTMLNDESNELIAVMEVVGVHLDLMTRKASPIPAQLRDRLAAMMASLPPSNQGIVEGRGAAARPDGPHPE
jgi:acyl-CoA thioester hydrolase